MPIKPPPLLSVENIHYQIKDKLILSDISLQLQPQQIMTIVGPNGAGKSTLLSIILGLIKPTSGQVILQENLRIGFVPQYINRDHSLPINVLDFIRLAKRKASQETIKQVLLELNIISLQKQFLSDLSGGELRRVLFARALINQPELLVLDEPTAGVDVRGQVEFYKLVNTLRQRHQFSILMVSHDLHLVMSATDQVICLNSHICCAGKPSQVVSDPSYLALFAKDDPQLAFYQHHHDHQH